MKLRHTLLFLLSRMLLVQMFGDEVTVLHSESKNGTTHVHVTTTLEDYSVTSAYDADPAVRDLYILGLLPMTGDTWPAGQALLTAIQMALEQVNNRTDILKGYRLNVVLGDSKCETGRGLNAMYSQLYSTPTKISILGPGCSIACEPCAEGAYEWNITMVSYSCQSSTLSNKKRFPRFFRTAQPELLQNPARIQLMHLFNWRRAATLQQSYDVWTTQMNDMIELMTSNNMTVISNEIFQLDASLHLENLKRHDARIIFAAAYEDSATDLICKAYKVGLKAQWVLPNWFNSDWWKMSIQCTPEQMLATIDGAIYTGIMYTNPISEPSISGMNVEEFLADFKARSNNTMPLGSDFAPPAYDGVWATALVLNRTLTKMKEQGMQKTLDEYTYADSVITDLMTESFHEIEFVGIRGYTKFDASGDPSGLIAISQQQGPDVILVGLFQPETLTRNGYIEWRNGGIQWKAGRAPRDGVVTIRQRAQIHGTLYAVICLLATLGLIMAAAFLAFNFYFSDRRVIKLSSPRINNLILLGCMLTYITVFFYTSHISFARSFCIIRHFTFVCGFTIAFGALFAKTWRLHIIMISTVKLTKAKIIRDHQLVIMVFALVLVNTLVLIIWSSVDPLQANVMNVYTKRSAEDPDIMYEYMMPVCDSQYHAYFIATLLIIQGILLIFGAFLAWETRKVKVVALNDSKHIGLCIYNVVILAVLGVAVNYVVHTSINTAYAFISGLIIAGTTLTQVIIFVPKVMDVRQKAMLTSPQTVSDTHSQPSHIKIGPISVVQI